MKNKKLKMYIKPDNEIISRRRAFKVDEHRIYNEGDVFTYKTGCKPFIERGYICELRNGHFIFVPDGEEVE